MKIPTLLIKNYSGQIPIYCSGEFVLQDRLGIDGTIVIEAPDSPTCCFRGEEAEIMVEWARAIVLDN